MKLKLLLLFSNHVIYEELQMREMQKSRSETYGYGYVAPFQEVGSERVLQEVAVGRPVLDVRPIRINGQNFVAVLTGADVVIYKWS